MRDYRALEDALRAIVVELQDKLTSQERDEVTGFVEHGEYGIALETLCSILSEGDRSISRESLESIRKVGTKMGLDSGTWSQVKMAD